MAESEGLRVIAEFVDYPGMLAALRARVSELQISGERFDEFAGLPRGYLSKLVGARPVRRVGMTSFSPLMNALGLRCLCRTSNGVTPLITTGFDKGFGERAFGQS